MTEFMANKYVSISGNYFANNFCPGLLPQGSELLCAQRKKSGITLRPGHINEHVW